MSVSVSAQPLTVHALCSVSVSAQPLTVHALCRLTFVVLCVRVASLLS